MSSESRVVTTENAQEIADWCGGKHVIQHDALDHKGVTPGINIPVGKNVERAQVGDIVIRNHDGSFQILKQEWM